MLLVLICHLFADSDMWFFLTAVFCLQWQIIGRIDDVMKLAKGSLLFNPREPYTLNVKMTWSKNIREEREPPTQILFGVMDPIVCPLLNIAMCLEGVRTMAYCCLVIIDLTMLSQVCLKASSTMCSFARSRRGCLGHTPFARALHPTRLV